MDLETEAKPRFLNHEDPRAWFLTDLEKSAIHEPPELPFKPGVHQSQAGAPGFLKMFLCGRLYVCVFVCVSAPRLLITSHLATYSVSSHLHKEF